MGISSLFLGSHMTEWKSNGLDLSNSFSPLGARTMSHQASAVIILFSILAVIACAQSPTDEHSSVQNTQMRDYWPDPATGLMWTSTDNGKDVTWKKSIEYCRDMRLADHSDWRLPTIDELQGIYDDSGYAAPPLSKGSEWVLAGKPKGGLLLTGNHYWSSTKGLDDRGHSNGYAWYFDFPHGKRDWDPYGYHGSKRALCVRRSSQ
jgi:hypothetical protein